VRWQSAAATPLWDAAKRCKSGVALRFPPQSKKVWLRLYGTVRPLGRWHGKYLIFNPLFKIPNWNLEASASSAVSWNMKSAGKLI